MRSFVEYGVVHVCRPIAMSVPDNDLIAEVLLASEGFAAAKILAGKLVALFSMCREGLSRQQHYDWGLRALKTCLGAAGRLLRQVRQIMLCRTL
jgi:dynein heavy chain 2